MIEKLCYVMGIQYTSDPDDSYVLTVDNVKKMLAIQMRFRYECVLLLHICVINIYSLILTIKLVRMACYGNIGLLCLANIKPA